MNKRAITDEHKREILERLYRAWHKNHQLRLGQLIWNKVDRGDLFYVEDEDFIKALEGDSD
jgi:hypothetical protein